MLSTDSCAAPTAATDIEITERGRGPVPPDVAQVCPLLLEDHAHTVTDGGMPVTAAPRIVALLGEQLWSGTGQELRHQLLSLGSHRKNVLERWSAGLSVTTQRLRVSAGFTSRSDYLSAPTVRSVA